MLVDNCAAAVEFQTGVLEALLALGLKITLTDRPGIIEPALHHLASTPNRTLEEQERAVEALAVQFNETGKIDFDAPTWIGPVRVKSHRNCRKNGLLELAKILRVSTDE